MAKIKSTTDEVWVNYPGHPDIAAICVDPQRASDLIDAGFVEVDEPVLPELPEGEVYLGQEDAGASATLGLDQANQEDPSV